MSRTTKSVTVRPDQETWIGSHPDFNFSKWIQDDLDNYIQNYDKLNELVKEIKNDKKKIDI